MPVVVNQLLCKSLIGKPVRLKLVVFGRICMKDTTTFSSLLIQDYDVMGLICRQRRGYIFQVQRKTLKSFQPRRSLDWTSTYMYMHSSTHNCFSVIPFTSSGINKLHLAITVALRIVSYIHDQFASKSRSWIRPYVPFNMSSKNKFFYHTNAQNSIA